MSKDFQKKAIRKYRIRSHCLKNYQPLNFPLLLNVWHNNFVTKIFCSWPTSAWLDDLSRNLITMTITKTPASVILKLVSFKAPHLLFQWQQLENLRFWMSHSSSLLIKVLAPKFSSLLPYVVACLNQCDQIFVRTIWSHWYQCTCDQ